jgi:hypothetical protein
MRHRGRDGQQQTRRCGQRRSQTTCRDQANHPTRKLCDFWVGQNENVVVEQHHFIAFPAFFSRAGGRVALIVILDQAIAILVFKAQKASAFPVQHPVGLGIECQRLALNALWPECGDDVQARHCTNSRGNSVKQRDEHQRPTSRGAGICHARNCEEADDDVGQTGGADHQRHGEQNHVEG